MWAKTCKTFKACKALIKHSKYNSFLISHLNNRNMHIELDEN